MNKPDDDIREFFAEMRKEDNQGPIPEFDELVKKQPRSRRIFLIPLGMAAAVLIAFGFYFSTDKKTTIPQIGELVITFSVEKGTNSQSLLSAESSIDSWIAPSDILLDDF